jgi:hypothetical protein
MSNLSTTSSADIGSQIGALELSDHLAGNGDDVLEYAGADTALSPTVGCKTISVCIGDGALEAATGALAAGPTQSMVVCAPTTAGCPHVLPQ